MVFKLLKTAEIRGQGEKAVSGVIVINVIGVEEIDLFELSSDI